ncbi:hypothetical protein PGN35_000860 [Nodosilinea sp. PGN35]|uniref:hypothetical protein n=1 Tax=Nodosilinea sp. PGN35 TaxID=3020489 RepID=UPI0023B354CD|nr:hypothetical protein [Nodosilinea sp. TSF1-S3]MDF0369038.1 hypothetical protein [Nodosilinea sp. TSF1-S3]
MVKFRSYFERHYPRLERVIAIIALINFGLVIFDLTYLNLRPVYRQYFAAVTHIYDPLKGIQAHPQTARYQAQVERLAGQLNQADLRSPEVTASLADLQTLSEPLVSEPAFAQPHGSYALATLQQLLQARTGQASTQEALTQFWSVSYLEQRGWQSELEFWDSQIQPFFRANYYRTVNRWGTPTDYFWLLDLPFVLIFAVDIGARIVATRRRHPALTWGEATLRRWYDLLLILPFWRAWRILPVVLRLYQVDVLNLDPVQAEAQRGVIVTVGADIAGISGIAIIEQLQDAIRQGELLNWIALIDPVVDSSGNIVAEEEMTAIAHRLYQVGIDSILPQVQPDIEDLVQHSIAKTLEQMPGYPHIKHLPGLGQVSAQVQLLSQSVAQNLYRSLASSLLDAEGTAITTRLQHHLREAIAAELSQHNTRHEIEDRLVSALDKFKYKYVKGLTESGGETLAEHTELLRRQIS